MNAPMNTKILLLNSDPAVRSVIQEAPEDGGYSVLAAGDLGTAVDRLKESAPDLLMVRSYVEGMPGWDAAAFLRRKCTGTARSDGGGLIEDGRLQYRMTLEGFEVFPKPFTAAELLEKVKDVLQKGSLTFTSSHPEVRSAVLEDFLVAR
jgi:CheY-like chemotaxis protein